ncbi:MAG: PQQ-dependent sugar dehydrogenase, partial [Gammaproteobacteria bacterium]
MPKRLPDLFSDFLVRSLYVFTLLFMFVGAAQAQSVSTDFEFTDLSGSFMIGASPLTATFTGGPVESRGQPELYTSGANAWHVSARTIAMVTFETPPSEVQFFFRNDTAEVMSEARVLDENGDLLQMTIGSADGFLEVVVRRAVGETLIGRVEVQNSGEGDVAVDDFSFTVAQTPVPPGPVPPDGFDPANPIPESIQTGGIAIELTEIAAGMTTPLWGAAAPGDTTRLFVADQTSQIVAIDLNGGGQSVFADVSSLLVPLGIDGPGSFDERGLLGFAFHLDYATNGLLYTYTSEPATAPADFTTLQPNETADHQSVITEWRVPVPADPASIVDPASRRELLRIDQPQFNHNGGALNFDADGLLYVSVGDGGGRDDVGVGHGDNGNGRDATNPLGAILRIDPLGNNAANGQYGIPSGNPFVGGPQT